MAKHTLGNANQKRYFAGFYLDAIKEIENDASVFNKKALIRAHQESCLFHLVTAYRSFIWEIANTYDEAYTSGRDLQQLLESAKENGKAIAELERLADLEAFAAEPSRATEVKNLGIPERIKLAKDTLPYP